MVDRRALPGKIRPDTLFLRTAGACDLDPEHLLQVFSEQRRRFVAVLRGFGPDDWAAPTRCADWSAQDVVRHLCDGDAIGIAAGPGGRPARRHPAGFDRGGSPPLAGWLAASGPGVARCHPGPSRSPATTEELLGTSQLSGSPPGRQVSTSACRTGRWTGRSRLLHKLSGIRGSTNATCCSRRGRRTPHPRRRNRLRDRVRGVPHRRGGVDVLADPVRERPTFGGDGGGGILAVDSRSGITLTVNRGSTAGPPAAEVADALAGRSPFAAVLGDLPPSSRAALSHMADFFNTPVAQTP